MRANIENRLRKLEENSVFRIATLADFVIWCARSKGGLTMPEVIEWDPHFKRQFDVAFERQ